jgi:hypothetical protein
MSSNLKIVRSFSTALWLANHGWRITGMRAFFRGERFYFLEAAR